MTSNQLAQALVEALLAQDFGHTPDGWNGGRPLAQLPSLDLAVAAFPAGAPPVAANVMLSRDHPRGLVATFDGGSTGLGAVNNVHHLADQRNATLESTAWLPGADWDGMTWQTLAGDASRARFVAPYPASLLKMMVAVGVGLGIDRGLCGWDDRVVTHTVAAAMDRMISVSDNDTTTELVALLHRLGLIDALHQHFATFGLHTLRLKNTRADGGWGNAAGAGVGEIQMTAWDSLRLMWLLDADAPPAPWLADASRRLLSRETTARLRAALDAQQLHEVLSSQRHRSVPGWVAGLPDELHFAHKTGTTDNYASDAGIVRGVGPARRHYLVAVITSLGRRYAPQPELATTWRLPALGAAIDACLAPWLELQA